MAAGTKCRRLIRALVAASYVAVVALVPGLGAAEGVIEAGLAHELLPSPPDAPASSAPFEEVFAVGAELPVASGFAIRAALETDPLERPLTQESHSVTAQELVLGWQGEDVQLGLGLTPETPTLGWEIGARESVLLGDVQREPGWGGFLSAGLMGHELHVAGVFSEEGADRASLAVSGSASLAEASVDYRMRVGGVWTERAGFAPELELGLRAPVELRPALTLSPVVEVTRVQGGLHLRGGLDLASDDWRAGATWEWLGQERASELSVSREGPSGFGVGLAWRWTDGADGSSQLLGLRLSGLW